MSARRNEVLYLALGLALSVMGILAASNPRAQIGLYALAGVGGVLLAMAIILKPYLGANILILAIFTNISDLRTDQGQSGIIKPLVLLVAGAIALHYADTRQVPLGRFRTSRIEFFLLLYFLVVAASYIVASDKELASVEILDLAKDLVILYCIQFALRTPAEWKQAVWVMMAVTAALCTLQLYQAVTGNYQQTFMGLAAVQFDQVFGDSLTGRLSGPINDPNLWGQVLVAVIPFAAYRFIYERNRTLKLAALGFVGLMLFVIFNTYSRGAYLALAVVAILLIIDLRVSPLLAFSGAVTIVLVLSFLPAVYADRFATLASLKPGPANGLYQESSLRGRSSEMLTGLEMFAMHPLLGIGAANYPIRYQEFAQLIGIETRSGERNAHSLYVQILAETGILGILVFIGLIAALLHALAKANRAITGDPAFASWLPWLSASRLSIIAYLTTSIFLHGAYIRYFWILVAIAITAIQLTEQQQQVINAVPRRSTLGPSAS